MTSCLRRYQCLRLVKFGCEEVFPLYPLEAFMLCNRSDLNRTTYSLCPRDRKLNKPRGRLHHEPRKIDCVLNRCSGQDQAFIRVRYKLGKKLNCLLYGHSDRFGSFFRYSSYAQNHSVSASSFTIPPYTNVIFRLDTEWV